MNRAAVLSLLVFSLVGCNDVQRPTLCVFRVTGGLDPTTVTAAACPKDDRAFVAGETFYVLHQLPPDAQVDAPLSVTIESPCPGSAVTTEHRHSEHKVLFSALAPAGADCSLTVTASILNETMQAVSQPASSECHPQCPVENAGGAGP